MYVSSEQQRMNDNKHWPRTLRHDVVGKTELRMIQWRNGRTDVHIQHSPKNFSHKQFVMPAYAIVYYRNELAKSAPKRRTRAKPVAE